MEKQKPKSDLQGNKSIYQQDNKTSLKLLFKISPRILKETIKKSKRKQEEGKKKTRRKQEGNQK